MRIAYIHQYFKTPRDSGGTRSYEMATRMVRAGHEVHMITTSMRPPAGAKGWHRETTDGIHVHRLPNPYSNTMGFASRIMAFARFAVAAGREARAVHADIIFATSTPLTIIIPAVYAKTGRRTPLVFEVRDLWPELPIAVGALKGKAPIWLAQKLERFAYRESDRIVALSPGMREGVTRTGYPEDRVSVIPNSADLDLFPASAEDVAKWRAQHPELNGRKIVLYAGTFGLINRTEYILDLAERVQEIDPSVAFVLVGEGRDEGALRARITAGDYPNVFIYPAVSKVEVPAWMHEAAMCMSVFAPVPAMEANSANKFFDTLASGTPVAINYGGWQAQLIETHDLGVVLDPSDLDAAARSLARVLSDRVALDRMGSHARRTAEVLFSRDGLAQELIQVLEQAVSGGMPK